MTNNPPLPRDVTDFQFKLVTRLKVYDRKDDISRAPVNLLAVSSKLGLAFVAAPTHLQIFKTSVLLESHGGKGVGPDVETFPRYCIPLRSPPSHIGISCDHVHVAVVLTPKDASQNPVAQIFVISSLISKNTAPAWEIQLSSVPGVGVRDIAWNPRLPNLICVCLCDGAVAVYELKGSSQVFESNTIPATTGARCICWSPKGKQLVIGTIHGPFIQYKPDLKQVKVISPPQNAGVAPISVLWLSSFQFAVVYGSPGDNQNGSSRPGLYIVNAPKGESESHLNYDDICYSSGEARPPQYYLSHIPKWNVLLMSSANSMEVGVLASGGSGTEPLVWEQWTLEDASRAELPLSQSREEMSAVGMAVDTSPTAHLPWGENQSIPPAPVLLILSNHGLLCSFNIINLRAGAAQDLCSPPEVVPGIQDVLIPTGPASSATLALPTSLPSFDPTSQNKSVAFPTASAAFSQGALPSFGSAASTVPSFTPVSSSPTPSSLFGGQAGKAEVGKGWLSGGSATSSFGFGALGNSLAPSASVPSMSPSPAQPFTFSVSSATTFPAATASAAANPQLNFSTPPPDVPQPAQQVPSIKPAQPSAAPQLSAQLPASVQQLQPNKPMPFQVAPPPVASGPSKAAVERSKSAVSLSGDVAQAAAQPPLAPAPLPSPSVPTVPDAAIFKAIARETALFTMELLQLKQRHQKFNVMIGTADEKKNLRVKVEALENFLGELSDATHGNTRVEIYALRTLLMEAFAWVEEARSRHLYSKNPRYLHLAMVQELDPVIKKHMVGIGNRVHYLDSQLQQLDSSLDNQWATFQEACSKKKRKQRAWGMDSGQFEKREIHMPSLEFVYQTILSQQQILEKHGARLDELEMKVRNRVNWELNGNSFASLAGFQSANRGPSANNEMAGSGEQDLSSMAESLLAMQLGDLRLKGKLSEQSGCRNPLIPKKMPSRQVSQLCSLLSHKPMTRVIPSPRGISSVNLLPLPSKLTDSKSPAQKESPLSSRLDSEVTPIAKPPKATSTPVKKDVSQPRIISNPSDFPSTQASISTFKGPSVAPSAFSSEAQGHQLPVFSMPKSEESKSTILDPGSKPTKTLAPISGPTQSSPSIVTGVSVPPATAASSAANVKSSSVPSKNLFGKGFPSTVPAAPLSLATTSLPSGTSSNTTPQLTMQSTSFFSGGGSTLPAATSSESSSWAFSASGGFSIGSSSKPGGISSGKPVVPPLATPATTTPSTSATAPAFSLNFSSGAKPSFSLTPKPATQSSFTLPMPLFGAKSGSTSSPSTKDEPLFVFGGSALGSSASKPTSKLVTEGIPVSASKESVDIAKDSAQKSEETKPDKVAVTDVQSPLGSSEKVKQVMPEKFPTTFQFGSSFGQALVPPGKTTEAVAAPAVSTPAVSVTAASAPSPALVQSPIYEDITPENKIEKGTVKERPQEKPPVTRNLFTDFSFKLGEGDSESFGAKPLVFGVPTSPPTPVSIPVSTPVVETPPSVASTPQLPVSSVTPTEAVSKSLPIIPLPETTSAISSTSNPLTSLGTIVANLGSSSGSTFGKVTSEAPKPAEGSSFTSFSFALPTKDETAKPPSAEAVVNLSTSEGQKETPLKGLASVSPPGTTTPSSQPVSGAPSTSATSDFGQGLANILGQSMPTAQQTQPAQNPFAVSGSGSVFGSSSGSSQSTNNLFGKPAEGSPSMGLFGQPIKQDAATPSFFGSSPSATPASTSVPAFGSTSVFGQPASSTSSVFGSSGFGSKPAFGQSLSGGTGFSLGGSVFGQSAGSPSVFGSPSPSSGTSGGNLFQSPATSSTSTFGASGGSIFGSVAQAGFGSPTSSFQAKPGGFGGSPVFGAMASGSTSPSFGGAATFGSPPAFGSHVFGASPAAAASGSIFGSGGSASTSTFENLASAPTLTFGNLAQSGGSTSPFGASQAQPPPAFGGGASSSGAGGSSSFGGSSFTSWR
ncbi:nuclear pore complex protein Nup214 isoform X2 [Ischnura elegans]|uniref:nuclear pore complex protein Nup214 isoform X2 n=1 Tax=Ischnura elegans TaxID=197161 RepID=UPI001ED89816|nr:nuclear pore complex protein Nup214 isoform X2 [Ischnura elegans]